MPYLRGIIKVIGKKEIIRNTEKQTVVVEERSSRPFKSSIAVDFWGKRVGALKDIQTGDFVFVEFGFSYKEHPNKPGLFFNNTFGTSFMLLSRAVASSPRKISKFESFGTSIYLNNYEEEEDGVEPQYHEDPLTHELYYEFEQKDSSPFDGDEILDNEIYFDPERQDKKSKGEYDPFLW